MAVKIGDTVWVTEGLMVHKGTVNNCTPELVSVFIKPLQQHVSRPYRLCYLSELGGWESLLRESEKQANRMRLELKGQEQEADLLRAYRDNAKAQAEQRKRKPEVVQA